MLPNTIEFSNPLYVTHQSVRTNLALGHHATLRQSTGNRPPVDVALVHRTEGYWPSGSAGVYQNEAYGVLYALDGATHGRWYANESEARAAFDSATRKEEQE